MFRAYDPRAARQQALDRLVTTEDELRQVLTAALTYGGIAMIRLGATIYITSPVVLPAGVTCSINGGQTYGILAASSSVSSIFLTGGATLSLEHTFVGTFGSFTVPCVIAPQSGHSISGVTMDDVRVLGVAKLAKSADGADVVLSGCHFARIARSGAACTIDGAPSFSTFVNCSGFTWALTSATVSCTFVSCSGVESLADTLKGSGQGSAILGLGARSLMPGGLLLRGSLSLTTRDLTISSASPTITPGDLSMQRLTFTAGASGNVTVAAGFDGQVLRLYCAAVAGTAVFTSGAGNLLLNSTFTPTLGAVLELQYDLTTATWVEVARSTASGAPLGSSYITVANDGTLTNERALAATSPLALADGGANAAITLSVADATTSAKGVVKLAQDFAGSVLLPQVIGLFGAPLAAMSPDGFVKRNAANTAWESIGYGSAADTVTQGNDSRLWAGAEGGYGQNFLRSSLPANNGGFLMVTGNAMFVYLGLAKTARTVNFVKFFLTVVGAGAQTAEVGLFTSPAAPNGAGQTLTKLAANGTLDSLTVGTGLKGNTVGMAQAVAAGAHLWAGLRCALATTQPTVGGIGFDYAQGHILTFAGAGVFTSTASYAATVIAAANNAAQAPGLMGYP